MAFFTFLLGSMDCEAPTSSRWVPGASCACPSTPRTGVFRQASDSVKTICEMDLRISYSRTSIFICNWIFFNFLFQLCKQVGSMNNLLSSGQV